MLCVILCYLVPYVNFFLIIIVICVKTFFFLRIYLTLNYHTLNLNFIHLYVTLMVCFKANFLLMLNLKCCCSSTESVVLLRTAF